MLVERYCHKMFELTSQSSMVKKVPKTKIVKNSIFKLKVTQQGQGSNQGHIMMLHTYIPQPMSHLLHLTDSEISRFFTLKVTVASKKSNQGHTMRLHTYSQLLMSLPSLTFLCLMDSEIQPGEDIQTQGHYGKDQINKLFPTAHSPIWMPKLKIMTTRPLKTLGNNTRIKRDFIPQPRLCGPEEHYSAQIRQYVSGAW